MYFNRSISFFLKHVDYTFNYFLIPMAIYQLISFDTLTFKFDC